MKFVMPEMFIGSGPQILAVFIGTINAVSDGMQYGWTAPSIPILRSENSPINITHTEEVWLELFYMIGAFVGLPFSILAIDYIGRKMTVWASSVIGVCGLIFIGAGNHVYYLFAGRLLLGITADIAFTASPIYISEIAHQKIRGFLAGLIYLMMLIGIIIIYAIGPWIPISASAAVGICLLLIQLVLLPFMPESPYYLIYVNKVEQAEKCLKRLRVEKDVTEELKEIQKAVERQKAERGRPQDLFLVGSNRKASLIVILLNGSQHFSGVSVFIMNLHSILTEAGSVSISPDVSAVVFPCLMFISAGTATLLIDDFGRKVLLAISGVLTSITLFAMAIYLHLKILGFSTDSFNWVPLIAVMSYAVTMKMGLGIVPIVISAELFPAKVKGMAMALCDFVYTFSSIVSIYLYQFVNVNFGMHVSFYLFAFVCSITSTMMWFFVPETKGKTLEQIQMLLKSKEKFSNKTEDTKL